MLLTLISDPAVSISVDIRTHQTTFFILCHLSIISKQSSHSPLISDIKTFSSIKLPPTGYGLFLGEMCVKIPADQQFLKHSDQVIQFNSIQIYFTKPQRENKLAPIIMPPSKSFKSPFFPILMLSLSFSKLS